MLILPVVIYIYMSASRIRRREQSPEQKAEAQARAEKVAQIEAGFKRVCEESVKTVAERIIKIEAINDLSHPEFPNPLRGIEGIKSAHDYLKEEGISGFLIGGLAESVLSNVSVDYLDRHKDVDVLVEDPRHDYLSQGHFFNTFGGGIDWWSTKTGYMTNKRGDYSNGEWYQNANGVVLPYSIYSERDNKLEPGLYVLPPKFVIFMKAMNNILLIKEEMGKLRKIEMDIWKESGEAVSLDFDEYFIQLLDNMTISMKEKTNFTGEAMKDIIDCLDPKYILKDLPGESDRTSFYARSETVENDRDDYDLSIYTIDIRKWESLNDQENTE